MSNEKILKKLEETITPFLKTKSNWKGNLEKKVWEILTTNKPAHTLVGEVKGYITLKNKEEKEYLILWIKEGEEKIHVYQNKLKRPEVWKEILEGKYHDRVVFLDFQKLYKLKILIDVRYKDK